MCSQPLSIAIQLATTCALMLQYVGTCVFDNIMIGEFLNHTFDSTKCW